jgi:hypothetical protein
MGKIMAFWFWQRPCRARPVLGLWKECRKGSQQRQPAVHCHRRESKMEIPVQVLRFENHANSGQLVWFDSRLPGRL